MEQVLEESKRKVRAWLKGWKASDGVPKGLDAWKDVRAFFSCIRACTDESYEQAFPASDWDTLILKHVLPQLGTTLRETFIVNPRQQDLKPLEDVLAWAPLLRPSMMSQLIEGGFFTKWLDALYLWLTSEPNLEQVAEWCVLFRLRAKVETDARRLSQVLVLEVILSRRYSQLVRRVARVPQGARFDEPGDGTRRRRQVPVRPPSSPSFGLD